MTHSKMKTNSNKPSNPLIAVFVSCGHISCFWCVHKSMSGLHESHCPICRHPYYHFPTICQMLHFLLLKIYPDAYRRRENQTLEEEEKMGCFSPQFDAYTCGSKVAFDHLGRSPCCTIKSPVSNSCNLESFECMEQSGSTTTHKRDECTAVYPVHASTRIPEVVGTPDEGKKLPQNEHNQQQKILIADVTCTMCNQLLFHPVVLNCGHVCCETCLINIAEVILKCQVCKSPHPRGSPKVCLALDHFLEEQFPDEYAQRRNAMQLNRIKVELETTSCSLHNNQQEKMAWRSDSRLKIHIGVGCDFCGMYPIMGDRYRCLDCKEEIGFDICNDCYKNPPKRPGRFNQQHTPEHKFELIRPNLIVREQLIDQERPENFVNRADDSALSDDEDDQNDSEATN
ncbi:E3 ubiquitin-protein ligase PRT1 isoform X2 [Cajanus cajan]|uniref:E3 ubiquitin-protein ligase PRT1 isoform X2 n=1 Tax=Cajanus cajan TaxID=3821 RepID=UPI00098D8D0A|nr:E3 ubiquitin-protein ligase PRT1 isoform X2 [Cajanus cajan]